MTGDEVDVWSDRFPEVCREFGISNDAMSSAEVEWSEANAARFVLGLLRSSRLLRWRFPRALSEEHDSRFAKWLATRGAERFGLSQPAVKKMRGVFRRPPGARIVDIYLQDRELQRLYPLGLLPTHQRSFLGWLTTHGRRDQNVQDHELLWFLHASAEDVPKGVALSYLVNPEWQSLFPAALTPQGWPMFAVWLHTEHGAGKGGKPLREMPKMLGEPEQRVLAASSAAGEIATETTGVNIVSHFCYPSGIQQAAFWTKAALERAGLRTSCRDVPAGIATRLLRRVDWLGLEVYPVTILTVAPVPYFSTAYDRSALFRRDGVYRIAYWAWELETVPEEWLELLPLLDEIWSPTQFVADAMQSRLHVPIHRMEPGVEVGPIDRVDRKQLGVPEDHYVFLFMFDMYSDVDRKNPFAVIRAFRQAFAKEDKATLVLKTSGGTPDRNAFTRLQEAAAEAGVVLIAETLPRAKAYGFIEMCDCYVSLHRSEGFGLGMAEAMLLGKPVIATGYSGNMSFMNRENSFLVDYDLVDVAGSGPLYSAGNRWAAPSEEHAASLMRRVFEDRSGASAVGARARGDAEQKLSLKAAGERMAVRLREISRERGA